MNVAGVSIFYSETKKIKVEEIKYFENWKNSHGSTALSVFFDIFERIRFKIRKSSRWKYKPMYRISEMDYHKEVH